MNFLRRSIIVIIFTGFMVSCSPVQDVRSDQQPTRTIEVPSATFQITSTSEVKIVPTSTNTLEPTQTPTKTEIVPALNGTPSPVLAGPIDSSNVKSVQVIRRTGSQRNIVVLGKNGDRWFVDSGKDLKFYDTKTNKLIWQTDISPDSYLINQDGTMILEGTGKDDFFRIIKESGEFEQFKIPDFENMPNGWNLSVNFQKKLVAINSGYPNPIKIYRWGETVPLYSYVGSLFGNAGEFSSNGDYLTYFAGGILHIVDAETGKQLTEFKLNFEYTSWKTSWDDQYLAISRQSTVEIWRLSDRKMVRVLQEKSDKVGQSFSFLFSEDSQSIMVLQPGKTIRTWSIASGELIEEEKTTEIDLKRVGINNDGKIIHYSLPQIPGRTWETEFGESVKMAFGKNGESLIFAHQLHGSNWVPTDVCQWDLFSIPSCSFEAQNFGYTRGGTQILSLGNDNEQYFIRPNTQPVQLFLGWQKEGKLVTQYPNTYGSRDFFFDPATGIIVTEIEPKQIYDPVTTLMVTEPNSEQCLLYNQKTRSRSLVKGRIDQFLISKDGNNLLALQNSVENPTLLEFVQYDSKTLKVISQKPLEQTIHPLVMDKTVEDLEPKPISVKLSPDGKNLYAYLIYVTKNLNERARHSFFLTIPLDTVEESTLFDLELDSSFASNMVITSKGDLAIVAQTDAGNIQFIETATGKVIHTLEEGGNPIKLALSPDGKLLAVADVKNGIQLVGIPGE